MNLLQPYILLYKIVFLILVGTLVVFSLRKKYENHPFEKYDSFGSWIIFFILSLFIGFRNETVGTDTSSYVSFFHSSQFLYNGEPTDPFFELFARLIHVVSPHTETFIAMTGVVSLFGIFFLIQKKSEHKCMSWILFCISGSCFVTLFLYLSAIRQACSITFFLFSVYVFYGLPQLRNVLAQLNNEKVKIFAISYIKGDLESRFWEHLNKSSAELPFDEYNGYAQQMDALMLLYNRESYKLTASVAILEVIRNLKPIFAIKNAYFEYLFDKFGNIWELFDNVENLSNYLNNLNDTFFVRYRDSLVRVRESLLPSRVKTQLHKVICN